MGRVSRAAAALATSSLLGLPSSAQQQQPVFRSGVDLITVDVTVVDRKGQPVEGLGPERFDVHVDGSRRRVVWAEFVPHRATARPEARSATHFTSNEALDPGRLILVAVDQMHIRRVEGLAALKAASAFIDALDPADRVAAAPLTYLGPIEFTADHTAVKRYVETLAGTASSLAVQFNLGLVEALAISDGNRTWLDRAVLRECGEPIGRIENPARVAAAEGLRDPCPVQVEQQSRVLAQEARNDGRQTLNSLMQLISRLAEIDGPKTLVLVSEGLIAEPQLVDLTSLGAAAQAARVAIYVLKLETPIYDASETAVSPTLQADLQARTDGLIRLAGSARGEVFNLVGSDPYPFNRILRELSGYYLVAFESSGTDRDGRAHHIDVSADAPGATVRTRPAFRASGLPGKAAIDRQIVRMLRSPRLVTELPLRIAAYAFQDAQPGTIRVLLSAETEAKGTAQNATIGFLLVNEEGVIAASGTGTTEDGRVSLPVHVPEGRYVVRAAAVDAGGRQGSVERRFLARLFGTGQVRFSDFVVAEGASGGGTLRAAVAYVRADRAAALFDIYGLPDWKPDAGSVTVEITQEGAGTTLMSVPVTISATGPTSWRVSAELPVGNLPPGTYIATAHVTLPGLPRQRLDRAFLR
ncbi:MAG TPA: VWA domain-containing protein [Vicinamibacterales bacterium]|nr:VWA domain-containing protein [Vicinamibacterales bacterium]